ncbi:MAG: DUF3784 domain-containing protein [Christensenellales bacterium]|jgi:hypothetical protein
MNIAVGIVVLLLSMACAVISVFQFRRKGFLFNNAYLYAGKREKEKMNKAPHYRQSGVVFAFLSALFLCIAAECILKTSWLGWISSALTVGVLIYAIVSSVRELGKR